MRKKRSKRSRGCRPATAGRDCQTNAGSACSRGTTDCGCRRAAGTLGRAADLGHRTGTAATIGQSNSAVGNGRTANRSRGADGDGTVADGTTIELAIDDASQFEMEAATPESVRQRNYRAA